MVIPFHSPAKMLRLKERISVEDLQTLLSSFYLVILEGICGLSPNKEEWR